MRTLFLGTSSFAVPSLRVVAAKTDLAGVVTQPDRPAGRGQKMHPSPVKSAALELGLPVYEPARLREFAVEIAGVAFDLFVLASYGRILPQSLLSVPRLGSLNVHPSLLPKYRGATPIQSALRNGDRETGVSIMLMDAGLDTGDVVLAQRVEIEPDETYGELHDRLALAGGELLGRAIALAAEGSIPRVPQSGEPSLTHPFGKDDLEIDLAWPAKRVVDAVRALAPQPGARARIDGETVKVLRAHVAPDGGLAIDEVVAPNRPKMTWEAYQRSRHDRA